MIKLTKSLLPQLKNSLAFRFPVLFYKPLLNYLTPKKLSAKQLANFNYVILCGSENYPYIRQTLFSVQKYFSLLPKVFVFVDFGTSKAIIDSIKMLYPANKLEVIAAQDCLLYHKSAPVAIHEFARKNPMGLKLAAILQIADLNEPVVYTDTDVLWHSDPINYITELNNNPLDMHMSLDYQASYDFNLIKLGGLKDLTKSPYYCAGVMLLKRISQQNRDIINGLVELVASRSNHFSEQTIFAHIQKRTGTSELSGDKILLSNDDQFELKPVFNHACLARHYVGPVRHLFWRDAFFKRLWKFDYNN